MVMNPISDDNRKKIIRLIIRCAKLAPHASENSQSKIEDISSNLTLYLDSDDGVWPDYRKTVPFDFILREFQQRLNALEAENPEDVFSKSYRILKKEGFNPEMMANNNAVRFVGKPKKALKVLKKNISDYSLSLIETDNGGIFLKLGKKFKGSEMLSESDFTKIFSKSLAAEPAIKTWFDNLIGEAHTFATEGMTAQEEFDYYDSLPTNDRGFGGDPNFGGVPTSNNVKGQGGITERMGDAKSFPSELLKLIEESRNLWPSGTKDIITENVISLDLRENEPDPNPRPEPPCKPVWREMPPDSRMSRIDAYNIVDSGRPSAPDGFAWSVSDLSESNNPETFRKSQVVTWPSFHIISGQKGVRRVLPDAPPEGFVLNETKPQKCSLFKQGFLLRIPSLSAEAVVIGYNILSPTSEIEAPEKVKFFKDSADGLYMEIQDYNSRLHADCTFTVTQAAPPYSTYGGDAAASNLFSCDLTFNDYKSGKGEQYGNYQAENVILQGSGRSDADKVLDNQQITGDMQIGVAIEKLYGWLYNWFCEDIPRSQDDMIGKYLSTNAGACRHRAYIMFLALNRLGLPCRMIGSTCHAWSEVWNPDTGSWIELDLNGCEDPRPPDRCPACMVKNPFYNIERDGELIRCCPEGYRMEGAECVAIDGSGDKVDTIECEKCIPRVCPEGYDCNPVLDKCVPDCAKLYGAGWHYHVERDECVNCDNEGSNLEWDGEKCSCKECPDDYEMDEDGNCVDENGLISGDAPRGFYFDKDLNQCYPRPDCREKEGTVFNPTTGNCDCPKGVVIRGVTKDAPNGVRVETLRIWDSMTGKCEDERQCAPDEILVYDPVLSDWICKKIESESDPTLPDPIISTPSDIPDEEDEEVEEEVEGLKIDKDARGTPKLPDERYVKDDGTTQILRPKNMANWTFVEKKDLKLSGRDSNNKRYSAVWEYADLYGVAEWLKEQMDDNLVSFKEPKVNSYFMVFSVKPKSPEADKHWNDIKSSIASVKNGIGRAKDGDSTTWQPADSDWADKFPPEWGLDFPDGDAWILMQQG